MFRDFPQGPPGAAWSDDESALLSKSRELTADYATQLKAALQESMTAGGPVEAITVCSELAPQLASDISRASGAKVRRTSLRFRNPGNAPDDWEAQRSLGVACILKAKSTGDNELTAKAVERWEKSLSINPDQPKADQLQKLIETYSN